MPADESFSGVAPDELKRAMTRLSSGVVVVATVSAGIDHALTATAFCSVSLDPPLVLVSVAKNNRFHGAVLSSGSWAVSILSTDQRETARRLSVSGRDLATQFDGIPWWPAPHSQAPILQGAPAWLDCRTDAVHDAGDHTLVVGRVLAAGAESFDATPLTYYQGAYSTPLAP